MSGVPGRTVETTDGPTGATTHALSRQGLQANGPSGDPATRHRAAQVSSGVTPDE